MNWIEIIKMLYSIINNDFVLFLKIFKIIVETLVNLFTYLTNTIYQADLFNNLTTIFIGASSLIIAVVIFAIERSVDPQNGNLLKNTLIKESRVKKLIIFTILSYFSLLLQLIIDKKCLVIFFRFLVLLSTALLLIYLIKGFISLISIFTNEELKKQKMSKCLESNIEKYNKMEENFNENKESCIERFNKMFGENDFIKYDPYFFDNNFFEYRAEVSGYIKKVNYFNFIQLNRDIQSKLLNKKINFAEKNVCVIRKMQGEQVKRGEPIIYINKEIIDLPVSINKFYEISDISDKYKNIIQMRIVDVFQFLIDSIIGNKIFDIKIAKSEIISLYTKLVDLNSKHSKDIYANLLELYRQTEILNINEHLSELSYGLAEISLEFGELSDFSKFLNIYYWISSKNIDLDSADEINQVLYFMKINVETNDKIIDKSDYIQVLLMLKQEVLKKLLEKNKINEIFEISLFYSELKIREVKNISIRIDGMKKQINKLGNLNTKEEIVKLSKEYGLKLKELSLNASIYLGILEWFRSDILNVDNLKQKSNKDFIGKIIYKFHEYNWEDILELCVFVKTMDNPISESWRSWEFQKPEHKNAVFSPEFNILNAIAILLFYSHHSFNNWQDVNNIVTRENKYIFTFLKEIISNEKDLLILNINFTQEKIVSTQKAIIKYLEEIIEKCVEKENEYIENSKLPEDSDIHFKRAILEKLIENRKGTIIEFYEQIGNVKISSDIVKNFWGYNRIEEKSFFVESFNDAILFYADNYSNGLINDQCNMIIDNLKKDSHETLVPIEDIIKKFKSPERLYILSPYYINEFSIMQDEKYYYKYHNYKIPVYIVGGLYNEIIIGDKNSFGKLIYYKGSKRTFKEELANDYTVANLVDFSGNEKIMKEYLRADIEWLKKKDNPESYLKARCNLKVCQKIEYKKSDNINLYQKPIN